MGRKAEESKTLFRWPFPSVTETDLMPNPAAVDSERDAGMSKMRKSLWKPNTELPPNRTCETDIGGAAMSGMSRVGDSSSSTEGVGQNAW